MHKCSINSRVTVDAIMDMLQSALTFVLAILIKFYLFTCDAGGDKGGGRGHDEGKLGRCPSPGWLRVALIT